VDAAAGTSDSVAGAVADRGSSADRNILMFQTTQERPFTLRS
jgi:hypothetical protein